MSRETTAQRPPAVDLVGFPTHEVEAGTRVHRAHLAANGPWWYASDGGGRFDLSPPRGTCYVATSPLVALRERLGPVLGSRTDVPAAVLAGVVVSRLHVSRTVRLANLRVTRAAAYGVTRELEVMVPYDVPQAWARAFDEIGLDGVRYGPRFTPGSASALAVFGSAGESDEAHDEAPVAATAVPGGPRPVAPPRRAALTVVPTPRTRRPH